MKPSFYAVAVGKARGIYSTWAQCSEQVMGHPGSIYKGFRTLAEARGFLAAHPLPSTAALVSVSRSSSSVVNESLPGSKRSPLRSTALKGSLDLETSDDLSAGERGAIAGRQARRHRTENPGVASSSEHLFTSTSLSASTVSHPLAPTTPTTSSPGTVQVVYVDGACSHNGTAKARAGYGGYYDSLSDPRNFSRPVPLVESQTNNRGELRAVIHAIVQSFVDAGAPPDALEATHSVDPSVWRLGDLALPLLHLVIYTDSLYVIDGLTRYAKKWVRNGFLLSTKEPVQNQDLWRQLIRLRDHYNTLYARQQREQLRRKRPSRDGDCNPAEVADSLQRTCLNTRNDKSEGIELIHVRGHSKVHGNEMADSLAVSGSRLHTL